MKLRIRLRAGLLGLVAALVPGAADPEDMVNALNGMFGSHKGYRAVHAKGFCGAGTLTATPEAAGYTKASLFDGHAVPTMVPSSASQLQSIPATAS